jgi:hypothetical protein
VPIFHLIALGLYSKYKNVQDIYEKSESDFINASIPSPVDSAGFSRLSKEER